MKITGLIATCARVLLAGWISSTAAWGEPVDQDIDQAPHHYRDRTPQDRFSRLKEGFESGQIPLDRSNEKAFLLSLLKALEIPTTSQMLVFSTTSLQLSLITPSNPRALYFNDDVYLGYVPGGRIEIVSVDSDLGGIFYLFDIPKDTGPLKIERSQRCMNCHAGDDTGHIPGLVIKSVVPGTRGGSLTAYRLGETGHHVPFADRFGGWYLTGQGGITNHWGNLTGQLSEGTLKTIATPPGERFSFGKFPVASSDLLPQLIHEHQAGFINRVVAATYHARAAWHAGQGELSADQSTALDDQAKIVTRYLLFADEVPLPSGDEIGDAAYKTDFLKTRRMAPGGISLRDFDLRTRLFKHRCSYMIYSPAFTGLPAPMKQRVYQRLKAALDLENSDPAYGYLPIEEKKAIHSILVATLPDFAAGR